SFLGNIEPLGSSSTQAPMHLRVNQSLQRIAPPERSLERLCTNRAVRLDTVLKRRELLAIRSTSDERRVSESRVRLLRDDERCEVLRSLFQHQSLVLELRCYSRSKRSW